MKKTDTHSFWCKNSIIDSIVKGTEIWWWLNSSEKQVKDCILICENWVNFVTQHWKVIPGLVHTECCGLTEERWEMCVINCKDSTLLWWCRFFIRFKPNHVIVSPEDHDALVHNGHIWIICWQLMAQMDRLLPKYVATLHNTTHTMFARTLYSPQNHNQQAELQWSRSAGGVAPLVCPIMQFSVAAQCPPLNSQMLR